MIEFIKKWVSKEKVLVSHCVKSLVIPDAIQTTVHKEYGSRMNDSQIVLTKEIAAKKNREQYASRGNNID